MKIGIFTSLQSPKIVEQAIASCKELGVDYQVVDIFSANWIQNVKSSDCDGFFCPSNCISQEKKTIQDERYFFVSQVMNRPIYPDFLGLYIHESKRNMASWLEINNYPHANTKVFTNRNEAYEFLENCNYPIVVKSNVGAGASKVRIIKSKCKAKSLARQCFPLFNNFKLAFLSCGLSYHHKVKGIKLLDIRNRQKDYFLVQEFIPNVQHEWRILKIGDFYFGHKKLLKGNFASGSGLVGWVAPPKELLHIVKELCDKGNFTCMDVDIFETDKGKYYINELQASFGSYLDYQMCIDGKHGRYKYTNGDFVFEEGDFNVHGSTKLKIEHFVNILQNK